MSSASVARPLEVRHLQLARALIAAIAAAMITFLPDHSSALGLSVFSGFTILTAIVLFAAAWLIFPRGRRGMAILLGVIDLIAGMIAGVASLRSDTTFFVLVAVWAVVTGVVEGVSGIRARRAGVASGRSEGRDAIFVGALGVVLAIALLCVPAGYALDYTIAEAHQTFTLTGITIGVGILGAYTAILTVYLGIAGFSPRTDVAAEPDLAAARVQGGPERRDEASHDHTEGAA